MHSESNGMRFLWMFINGLDCTNLFDCKNYAEYSNICDVTNKEKLRIRVNSTHRTDGTNAQIGTEKK